MNITRRHQKDSKNNSNKQIYIFSSLILVSVLIIISFVVFKYLTLDKFIYVNKSKSGDAEIIIIDNQNNKNSKYQISSSENFESARGYGEYKLNSLWQLSKKDPVQGRLVSETIVKNMSLPIYLWKDNKRTNLSLIQRIKAYFVENQNKSYDDVLDLSNISNSIYIDFVYPEMNDERLKINVDDYTGEIDTINKISKIIEVMGGKITSNSKGYDENLDCELSGKKASILNAINKIIDCKIINSDSDVLNIKLGAKFAERF